MHVSASVVNMIVAIRVLATKLMHPRCDSTNAPMRQPLGLLREKAVDDGEHGVVHCGRAQDVHAWVG